MSTDEKKNVVLMIPQMRHGGAERVVSNLSYLLKDTYNVKVVIFDNRTTTYDLGSDVYSLDVPPTVDKNIFNKSKNILKRVIRYKKFKEKYKVDITYSFGDTANIINVFSGGDDNKVISIRGFKRIRMGKTITDKALLRPLSILICRLADRIVSVSELMTATLIKEYNLSKEKIFTVYNGYNVSEIQKLMQEELDSDTEEELFDNDVVITAGTFRHEKGYWHLLKAFKLVLKERPNTKLVILGIDSNEYINKVKELADKLNITDSIFALGYKNNPFRYINKSNLYVLSSVFEGFPNSLVEAMCCGVPVVAADCPSGPREILSPDKSVFSQAQGVELNEFGILTQRLSPNENFNPDDIEEGDAFLAKAILSGLDDKTNEKYANKSLERAHHFTNSEWLKNQKEALDFY